MTRDLWRRILPDLGLILLLLVLPLMMFHQQTLGDRTLLPTENLYQSLPHSVYREVVGAPAIPHNHLISDMVLQNYQWKSFIREQIAQGEIPLWNPHLFAGVPFWAAGQHSALYPLSIIYYVLPLSSAYGWFIVISLWLAGLFMAGFMRSLGVNRFGAALAGVVYQLSGFMIVSALFPMVVASAVWMPLALWMVENVLRGRNLWIFRGTAIPWVLIGAGAIACNILAGHIEVSAYTMMTTLVYAGLRLLYEVARHWKTDGAIPIRWAVKSAIWLLIIVLLGTGLAGVQLAPLVEFAQTNWRAERDSLEAVLNYAHKPRDFLQFLLPNFYGNPSHHSYVDVFSMERVTDLRNAAGQSIDYIEWGIKNYVEGALYLGVMPLLLATYAFFAGIRRRQFAGIIIALTLIALLALSFMFGAPTYAFVFKLPGMNQLNSPFRWVYILTVAVAAMSGLGLHLLVERRRNVLPVAILGLMVVVLGGALIIGAGYSYSNFAQLSPLFDRIVAGLANAEEAFSDGRMFFSYQFPQVVALALMLLASGVVFLWAARWRSLVWMALALLITAVDLLLATYGFYPASDPLLLAFTPPAIEYLQGQDGHFRITSLEADPEQPPILSPNTSMGYGLDDVRGYDSIVPAGYVATMRALQPQPFMDHNRISPVYTLPDWNHAGGYEAVLAADLFNLLNIRYVLTPRDWQSAPRGWKTVYADEAVTIWENESFMPRAFAVAKNDWDARWLAEAGGGFRFGEFSNTGSTLHITNYQAASISRDTAREKFVDVSVEESSWLVISESYAPGWRAFARPWGGGESEEFGLAVRLVLANFQGVELPAGNWTVRLVYSPASVHLGMFASTISVALIVLLLGTWFWRAYIGMNTEQSSGVAKVARNSLAPIILNLFNRGIDMAFAIVMYRLLQPFEIGIYSFAVVLFVWFDIFTNFGLDLFLIRATSQRQSRAGHYLYNTSFFRLVLSLTGVPMLAGAMLLWQSSGVEAISADGLTAIGLLYLGLFPASLSKGMTSLFYANEQAEKPAAIATITTLNKAVFGVIVLLLGFGIVGLAAVSIFNNVLTLLVLVWAGRRLIGKISQRLPDSKLIGEMVGESFPLMLNHFLATIFFQIDIVILQAIKGAETVAQYSTAYKWLLAINIVPAFFTQALFPVMSRQAKDNLAALERSCTFGIKLLFAITLPMALVFTVLAEPLTLLLGGSRYVPDGTIALKLMIWSIPFGWMNSLMQYVLVALGRQRLITRAFAAAVVFNITANILFIPQFGFQAAAIATIASELVLFLPFIYLVRGSLRQVKVVSLLWRPLAAFAVMLLVLSIFGQGIIALFMAALAYVSVLIFLRPLDAEEGAALMALLPESMRGFRLARWVGGL